MGIDKRIGELKSHIARQCRVGRNLEMVELKKKIKELGGKVRNKPNQ